jgi:hypothetical protein
VSSEDPHAETVEWNDPPPDVEWNDWGPPRRVRIALTRGGLYLHGEQHFTYHRQVCVGDVLESRTRTSKPVARVSRRGPLEVTWYQTRWTDPEGSRVVNEQIVSLFFPDA